MAHKRLTYKDIPIGRRKETATKALGKLKEALSNPVLTPEQDVTLRARIDHINKWAAGKLETDEVPADKKPKKPKRDKVTHHEVVVEESLTLEEEGP